MIISLMINTLYTTKWPLLLVPFIAVSVAVCMLIANWQSDFSYHKVVQVIPIWWLQCGMGVLYSAPLFLHYCRIAFLVRLSRYLCGCFTCYLDGCWSDGILTESMMDKLAVKLGSYIPESQVLTERFEANANNKKKNKMGTECY